ncbi:MAG: hypothetical protein EOP00_14425 [Pedobacter sp.]|nr:MAG: hypothetical protein EOP00_14425 [Pedobacter sp.]
MITIIICSIDKTRLNGAIINIEQTIGVEHEIIAIDNSIDNKGICKVYNTASRLAKFDLMCFMHEDIEIKTQDWGLNVIHSFESNANLGALGVAGSAYKTSAPGGWDIESDNDALRFINYIQQYKNGGRPTEHIVKNNSDFNSAKVVCVDGMWLCTTKKAIEFYPFDEYLLTGFHGYDLDFCLGVGKKFDVEVTFNVLMAHFSEGSFGKEWFLTVHKLHQKWYNQLPKSSIKITEQFKQVVEKRAFKRAIVNFLKFGFTKDYVFDLLKKYKRDEKINLVLYIKLWLYTNRISRKKDLN